ncbi:hypothetical protein HC928_12330, partial [bacterium]|nr:hypothetical protein [bacterium]
MALSELTEKVTEIIHSSNKSVALSMVTYTMANVKYGGVTKADAYKIVKSSESTQGSLWSALSGVMQQFPQELKPYEDDLIGFDGGMMLISTSINSRKEAAAELANYLDTGSLKSLDQYEKKLRESMGFMAQGVNKVKKVGDELGVQVEITTTLDEAVEEVKTVLSDLEKYPFIAGMPSTEI